MTSLPQDFVWLLNPDAEIELSHAARSSPRSYNPSREVQRTMESKRELFSELVGEDPWCFLNALDESAAGRRGVIWCATPGAVERATRAGVLVAPAPSWDCLLPVHDKTRLSEFVEPCLPNRTVVNNRVEWQIAVSQLLGSAHPTWGICSRVRGKRPYGFAGRGQRILPEHPSDDDERWIADSLRQGPLVVEPQIENARLASIHGMVDEDGAIIGRLLFDKFDAPWGHAEPSVAEARDMALCVARALLTSGYAGPFGLDIILDRQGSPHALDLNPRFTLRWSTGLGGKRELAMSRLLARIPIHR